MTDILETLEDLPEDFDLDENDDSFPEDELSEVDDAVEDYEMSEDEAKNITEAIRSSATATYILLSQAHAHKAHKALGYETWADYVTAEFDITTQRSYQLLDLSRAVAMIEEVVPEGTSVKLTEAQARDIKRELPNITEQIALETQDQSPEEASESVDRIINDIREQKKSDDKELENKKKKAEEAELEGYQAGLEAAADALLEADQPSGLTDVADDGLVEVDIEGSGGDSISPEASMHLYNFFNVLSSIGSLPDPEDFVKLIPEDRREEVDRQLLEATGWLNRTQTLWELRED